MTGMMIGQRPDGQQGGVTLDLANRLHTDAQASQELVSITDMNTTHAPTRGVLIFTAASYDVYVADTTEKTAYGSGTPTAGWITLANLIAGVLYPLTITGIRKTTGPAAPTAGDVVFVY